MVQAAKKKVYIETIIPSVITARPSRDIGNLYHQEVSREFLENERFMKIQKEEVENG